MLTRRALWPALRRFNERLKMKDKEFVAVLREAACLLAPTPRDYPIGVIYSCNAIGYAAYTVLGDQHQAAERRYACCFVNDGFPRWQDDGRHAFIDRLDTQTVRFDYLPLLAAFSAAP